MPLKVELIEAHKTSRQMGKVLATGERTDRSIDLEALARLMDSVFRVPGFNLRFGLDAIIGLLPGVGDILTSMVSIYILHHASQVGVSRITLVRMGLNIAVDLFLGSIPFVGDIFDVYWKANNRNVALLRSHLNASPPEQRRLRRADHLFVWLLSGILIAILALSVVGAISLLVWLTSTVTNGF